tara:strand:+ start:604 stop:6711 length:6108 start_codon:yes stop_codon:yes gene_type:complete
MPEINTTFTQGRMNLDLEEKILPNGEYRGALNIQVSTSDEDSVGSVQPIMGNKKLTTGLAQDWNNSYQCIGSIADEKNDVAYWFLVKDDNTQSAILRCFKNNNGDLETGIVLSDNQNKVLEFTVENYITGISIVDDFLYFTDGVTEPKVVNITQFLNNTNITLSNTSNLYVNGEDKGTVTKHDITVIKPRPLNPITLELVPGEERQVLYNTPTASFVNKTAGSSIQFEIGLEEFKVLGANDVYDPENDGTANNLYLLGINPVTGKFEANYSGFGATNFVASSGQGIGDEYYDAYAPLLEVGDILLLSQVGATGSLPSNVQARLEITSLAVDPSAPTLFNPPDSSIDRNLPLKALITCDIINVSTSILDQAYSFNIIKEDLSKVLFEKTFPRFSYRYKYSDNQYSSFAPFTQAGFLPGRFNIHPTREPYNTGMENNIKKIILKDFVHQGIPRDVIEIDLLYKSDDSPIIYTIDTIKPKKSDGSDVASWHSVDNNGSNTFTFIDGSQSTRDNTNSGYYELTKDLIYAALPELQTLRIYDNVPKKAKAQDFTAGRIIYGNYTQNLNVQDYENDLKLDFEERKFGNIDKIFDEGGLNTVKSQRTYQVGMSLLDYQGRETPVFSSGERGSVTIPFNLSTDENAIVAFEGTASKSHRLKVLDIPNIPCHVNVPDAYSLGGDFSFDPYYFKLYIKETSSEYYNLVLDRVYRSKEDGSLWISFPSADRNKIKEEDFIILKKPVDSDSQVQLENKFKIIAIENEAPEFIRDKLRSIGNADGDASIENLFPDESFQPAAGQRKLVFKKEQLISERVVGIQQLFNKGEDLSIKFKKIDPAGNTVINSEVYTFVNVEITADVYTVSLDKPIQESDSWVETSPGILNEDLQVVFFVNDNRQWQEFQGRFFVKIRSNIITAQYLEPLIGVEIGTVLTARAKTFSLRDDNLFDTADSDGVYSGTHSYGQNTTSNTGAVTNALQSRSVKPEHFRDLFNHETNNQGTDGSDWFIDELHYVAHQPLETPSNARNTYRSFTSIISDFGGDYASEIVDLQQFDASVSGNLRSMSFNPTYGNTNSNNSGYTNSSGEFVFKDIFDNGTTTTLNVKVSQLFRRSTLGSPMNGMQGIVTTVTGHKNRVSVGSADPWPLVWKKQTDHINAFGLQNYRDVYGTDTGKFFMHLSFGGVGVDLMEPDAPLFVATPGYSIGNGFFVAATYSPGGQVGGNQLTPPEIPGGVMDLQSIINCGKQINISSDGFGRVLPFPQEPNTRGDVNWRIKAETQWDPVGHPDLGNFRPGNKEFINKLETPGSVFRFSNDTSGTSFIIRNTSKVRVYNHTPWNLSVTVDMNAAQNGQWFQNENSVAYHYHRWHTYAYTPGGDITELNNRFNQLEEAVRRFGRADNRRICYIVELDKDPRTQCSINPETFDFDFDGTNDDFGFIEFFEQDFSDGVNEIKDNPAIFETEPKEKVDLDLYYEASPTYPIKLDVNSTTTSTYGSGVELTNNTKGYLAAKVGTKVKVSGTAMDIANTYVDSSNNAAGEPIDCRVKSWDGDIVELAGGISALGGAQSFNFQPNNVPGVQTNLSHQKQFFTNKFLEFYDDQEDGYIKYKILDVVQLGTTNPTSSANSYNSIIKFRVKIIPEEVGLPYFNAFSFGNGVESNRIRDDFNQTFIKNGARVSTTLQEKYKQDTRTSGLIFSGIYNKNTSLNDLNQFIQADNITKELDTTYGSIQKLFARNSDLIALCEDKIVQIFADKDLIFNADGNTQLTASNKVLGQSRPFVGEYGISKNPESFASSSYRAYFTDKQRGAVLRLSMDGLTPISDAGMRDWFRDKLKSDYYRIVGSYDKTKNDYNLTFDSGYDFDYVEDDFNTSKNVYKNADQSITVTYKENVKGWSSFKGFIQESGVIVNNEYITFRDGKAFHHNENVGACHFYGTNDSTTRIASVNAIFNDAPLSIKNFNTLNYVGDFKGDNSRVPAWTCNRLETERGEGRILSTPFDTNSVIDNPNVNQFVKKEEKAFAYIQHMHSETDGTIDTESQSNLGIGEAFEHEQL